MSFFTIRAGKSRNLHQESCGLRPAEVFAEHEDRFHGPKKKSALESLDGYIMRISLWGVGS